MHEREKELRQRLKDDFIRYAETCLRIRTKGGVVAPFRLNAAQRHVHERLERQLRETGRVRALILKGRQQGCSTYAQGRFYWKVTHGVGRRAFILTHLDDATRNLYQIVQRFHEHCPEMVRPQVSRSNAREFVFGRLDSEYRLGTARSRGVGRSHTIQFFHGSEVAFWANAEEHVAGVLQAVPDEAGTEVILESTSAGPGGTFYEMCRAAMRGESDYIFIFVPWFWQEEYRRVPPEGFALTADEAAYGERFGLDDAQLCWRRARARQLGGEENFRREYPATPEEAFHADNPRALWNRALIGRNRRPPPGVLKRTVIAVDPAVTAKKGSDETGIIVAALGEDGHAYVLADLSGTYTPAQWAALVVKACAEYDADRVVAEVNQGGALVEHTLRAVDGRIPYKEVRASRGKIARAEPVAALDEQGRVHHAGVFAVLEDQMCGFEPDGSELCDRVDARVWAITELMLARPVDGPKVWMT